MSIRRRSSYTDNYTIIDRRALEDTRLSWAARGLLAYLMSKPDHWKISVSHLKNEGEAGRDKIYNLLSELVDMGYATREQLRGEAGQLGEIDYVITDIPPLPALPDTAAPDTAKPTLVNTDTKQVLITSSIDHFDEFWKIYPKKVKKAHARKAFEKAARASTAAELSRLLVTDVRARLAGDRNWIIPAGQKCNQFTPDPTTYLNGARWEDEIQAPQQEKKRIVIPQKDTELVELCRAHGIRTLGKVRFDLEQALREKLA